MDPDFEPARRMLGAAYLAAGQTEQANHELQAAVGHDADDAKSLAWLAHAKAIAGFHGEAVALTQKIEALAKKGYVPAYHLALAHTGLGNRDVALALLEKASRDRDPAVINGSRSSPAWSPSAAPPLRGPCSTAPSAGIGRRTRLVLCHTAALNSQLLCFDFHGFTRRSLMTARRFVVAVLALAV